MIFYLLDVKSTENVNGTQVPFDYVNTYYNRNKAISEAKKLSKKENVLEVSVHPWILNPDGTQEHAEDGVIFHYLNRNHWEMRRQNDER